MRPSSSRVSASRLPADFQCFSTASRWLRAAARSSLIASVSSSDPRTASMSRTSDCSVRSDASSHPPFRRPRRTTASRQSWSTTRDTACPQAGSAVPSCSITSSSRFVSIVSASHTCCSDRSMSAGCGSTSVKADEVSGASARSARSNRRRTAQQTAARRSSGSSDGSVSHASLSRCMMIGRSDNVSIVCWDRSSAGSVLRSSSSIAAPSLPRAASSCVPPLNSSNACRLEGGMRPWPSFKFTISVADRWAPPSTASAAAGGTAPSGRGIGPGASPPSRVRMASHGAITATAAPSYSRPTRVRSGRCHARRCASVVAT